MTAKLGFGRQVPEGVETAWGARLIYPDDMLYDRQDAQGPRVQELIDYLNGQGATKAALREARRLADSYEMQSSDPYEKEFTLYEDDVVKVVGSPQGSYGYLYVAAFFKDEVAAAALVKGLEDVVTYGGKRLVDYEAELVERQGG